MPKVKELGIWKSNIYLSNQCRGLKRDQTLVKICNLTEFCRLENLDKVLLEIKLFHHAMKTTPLVRGKLPEENLQTSQGQFRCVTTEKKEHALYSN